MAIPESVEKRFNWGAFFFGWLWGIFHKSFITLIQLPFLILNFPFSNLIVLGLMIWFGIKGNAWAWEKMAWQEIDENEFHAREKKWAIAGTLFAILIV